MIEKFVKGKVAVFIDTANLENSAKDLKIKIRYQKLYKFLKNKTNLRFIRFYSPHFGTDSHNRFLTLLKRTGFKLITKPLKIIEAKDIATGHVRKANFDVEIAVDVMENLDNFDTMVLFSGDSDFDYLVQKIRKKGKAVIIVSTKHHISRELIKSANKYIDIKKLKSEIT